MLDMIGTLIDKGYAYEKNGTVYYRTRKFQGYGKLSKKNLQDQDKQHLHHKQMHTSFVQGHPQVLKVQAFSYILPLESCTDISTFIINKGKFTQKCESLPFVTQGRRNRILELGAFQIMLGKLHVI